MLRGLSKFSLPELEEKVLHFWRTNRIFEKSLAKTEHGREFVFYEGPPTANGRPGIHHVLARAFKDVIPRYKTMRGYHVPRKGGWDTHGLPVELEVERQLGLKSKKEIERFGIAEFNKKCKESVWKYKDEWERLTERIGFWLDLKDPYITYENKYIETLWWIIKQIWDEKLLFKGHKVVPWCTRCGTALSSHELALGYKEIEENSVYIKFKLKSGQRIGKGYKTGNKSYILSWTTTPWTLPGNVALAMGKDIEYSLVAIGEGKIREEYILATERLSVLSDSYTAIQKVHGKELTGLTYEPLFQIKTFHSKAAYKVYPADFVTTAEGTGVVHIAVMYGEDDYELGRKVGLPQHHIVDEQGKFLKDTPKLARLYVKAPETEKKILKILEENGNLLKTETYVHDYPFCWRCNTPLLYYARDSWFVGMSKLRTQLLKENAKINWIPESTKDGRFGEWLREVKDWAFSRERYWGTPLPIWKCEKCGAAHGVGSIDELETLQGKSTNKYVLVRHGQAETNLKNRISCWPEKTKMHLTLKGRVEVEKLTKKLSREKVGVIFSSDITRTRETAQILKKGFPKAKLVYDKRLREINAGKFNGGPDRNYHAYFTSDAEKFTKQPPGGETLTELRARLCDFIRDVEKRYRGGTMIIVSHEYPIWMLTASMQGWSDEEALQEQQLRGDFIRTGEAQTALFKKVPRDETGKMDLHRPYIDAIAFACKKCGAKMKRVPEVVDVWFDSGAMPFAQVHWPFSKEKLAFPADYIAEGVDQTRGWFYTLLAVAVLLGRGAPYKNVISHGLVLDKNGQKMSKSKGNIADPWAMIEKYGTDVLRWYFFTINPPGEPKKFDEIDLQKTLRQFILLLYNSFVFFNTYAKRGMSIPSRMPRAAHILDKWILARLGETVSESTKYLERYEVGDAARKIEEFVGDLSRWYIRRSRRRFQPTRRSFNGGEKPENQKDYLAASQTLGFVLCEVSKLIAPFTPFFAEGMYKSLITNAQVSVHLERWPKASTSSVDQKLLRAMEEVRRYASVAFAKRAEARIKVRQPLKEIKIRDAVLGRQKELIQILKDEVNVKEVKVDEKMENEVWLDTTLTHELEEEGLLREFIRMVQGLRQDAKLEPKDKIVLSAELPKEFLYVAEKNEAFIKKEVNAKAIEYHRTEKFDIELETKVDGSPIWLALRKPK